MNYREEIIAILIQAKIPSPRLETDIILRNYAPDYPKIIIKEKEKIAEVLQRRSQHEPLDKIIGKKEFYKSIFKVSSDVLSPRPDTEILVETALEYIKENKLYHILDLGTGTGCILLSILKERPLCRGIGVDISKKAIETAQENAREIGVEKAVQFINTDWNNLTLSNIDIIVSNPPYISKAEIETLDKEVKNYDPLIALEGGEDGLQCYRDIAEIAPKLLKDKGYILLEVGYNQANNVKNIFADYGFKIISIKKDLNGIDRCIILQK